MLSGLFLRMIPGTVQNPPKPRLLPSYSQPHGAGTKGFVMKRLHEGLDYTLYKVYVWGGLPAVVIQIVVSVLVFDAMELPTPQPFFVIMGPALLWFAGILLYWWWVFIFKGRHEWVEWRETPSQGVPPLKALQSWSTDSRGMDSRAHWMTSLLAPSASR